MTSLRPQPLAELTPAIRAPSLPEEIGDFDREFRAAMAEAPRRWTPAVFWSYSSGGSGWRDPHKRKRVHRQIVDHATRAERTANTAAPRRRARWP